MHLPRHWKLPELAQRKSSTAGSVCSVLYRTYKREAKRAEWRRSWWRRGGEERGEEKEEGEASCGTCCNRQQKRELLGRLLHSWAIRQRIHINQVLTLAKSTSREIFGSFRLSYVKRLPVIPQVEKNFPQPSLAYRQNLFFRFAHLFFKNHGLSRLVSIRSVPIFPASFTHLL